jgi:hypothetical protein
MMVTGCASLAAGLFVGYSTLTTESSLLLPGVLLLNGMLFVIKGSARRKEERRES